MDNARLWPILVVASALTSVCAVAAGVAASSVSSELTRGPTAAELRAASQREVAERWRTWDAGRIFPATLSYSAEQGGKERARRLGISPTTGCAGAVDAVAVPALTESGCRAVLRATYIDALRGVLVTIGVVALPDAARAARAKSAFPAGGEPVPGLLPLAFRGTVADRFAPSGAPAGLGTPVRPVPGADHGRSGGRTARWRGRAAAQPSSPSPPRSPSASSPN
ncbi:hypothetical protein ACFSTC_05720 [Nonomuraea ferruginea]